MQSHETSQPEASAPRSVAALLRVIDVSVNFGGIVALNGVSFDIAEGEICGLIGPNGAGKTTLFNCLSRLYGCNRGSIEFDGIEVTGLPRHRIASLGVARTFQNLALFRTMSVLDNVRVGCHSRTSTGFIADALRLRGVAREERATRAKAMELLGFLGLEELASAPVSALPFGTQKRVELARALAAAPRLLLLDEPASGLNHEEVGALGKVIRRIRDELAITILLVEHHMGLVMGISDKVVALAFGRVIAAGSPAEVQSNESVIHAYLGQVH